MRRRILSFSMFFGFIAPFTLVLAGGWTSGGGNIVRDSNNPWFLKNVTAVSYCIRSDQANFSDLPTPLSDIVKRALDYWKSEFEKARRYPSLYPFGTVDIATQSFEKHTCSGKEDITFQFGVLDRDQREYLGDPTSRIGVTVRTSYDPVRLRGKGFVYVSSDSGPLRYRGELLIDRAWHLGKSGLLFHTLAHEVGHLFGLPHYRSGIMAEYYPDMMLNKDDWRWREIREDASESFDLPGFFLYRATPSIEGQCVRPQLLDDGVFLNALGVLPEKDGCIRFRSNADSNQVDVTYSSNKTAIEQRVAMIQFSNTSISIPQLSWGPSVYVTDTQTVFPWPGKGPSILIAQQEISLQRAGTLIPSTFPNKRIPIVASFEPDYLQVSGTLPQASQPFTFRRNQWP